LYTFVDDQYLLSTYALMQLESRLQRSPVVGCIKVLELGKMGDEFYRLASLLYGHDREREIVRVPAGIQ